ncbi:MAG: class I SAM-dependent methyltransferase [Calothrix sp. MO_192.B10]|nr:class I SAM-dependent methyltransferase [Calothrix sp. MO_192.B10]
MLEFEVERNFAYIESVIVEEDWEIFGNHHHIATSQYYNFYYSYARSWQPKSILEIGVRRGYSAVAMAIGAGNNLVNFVGIDSETDVPLSSNYAKEILQNCSQAEIKLINLDTQKENLADNIGKFDLIHVDADHTFYGCISDILLALYLSHPGTKIIIDDCLYAPVRAAVESVIKIYPDDLQVKYVANFRGHGLIEVSRSFPELFTKQSRDKIVDTQASPFTSVIFSDISDNYSYIRTKLEKYYSDNQPFPNEILNSVSQTITKIDSYLQEVIGRINIYLESYHNTGFDVTEIIQVLNSINYEISSGIKIANKTWENRLIGKIKQPKLKYIDICKRIYSRLYSLNQFRLKLLTHSVGTCFNYFCRESTKHFEYLAERIRPGNCSDNLPSQLINVDNNQHGNQEIYLTTHEGYLFIIVLADALINIVSCFESEIEAQYWMNNWNIANNQTWQKLIIPMQNKLFSPIPFPVKNSVEYDDFYNLQHIGNAGGIQVSSENIALGSRRLESEDLILHPTDHLFRIFTTITHIEIILKLLQERYPGQTIKWLDVGCGIGFIPNRVKFDGVVVGVDVADSLVEHANATRRTKAHHYITGNLGDARNLINGEKFHLITANEVVEHIFDPVEFICELSNHTSDMIYASSPLKEQVPYRPTPEHLWSFTLESYSALFEAANMKITYSGILEIGKYIGESNNWLSVCATLKEPFRVLPIKK